MTPRKPLGLIDRAESSGLVVRRKDSANHSMVRLQLTPKGSRQLEGLSELHLEELFHLAPAMHALWDALEQAGHREAPERRLSLGPLETEEGDRAGNA